MDYRAPSFYQVRYAGCKGVLSVFGKGIWANTAAQAGCSGKCIQTRDSMRKFGSPHQRLEVCCVANWLPAYLNRQVIRI